MATPPDEVRTGLTLVTTAAIAEVQSVAQASPDPTETVSALFTAVPLIVGAYVDGSSALALDWYDEIRDESSPSTLFEPAPITLVREGHLGNVVAWATQEIRSFESDLLADLAQIEAEMLAKIEAEVQKEVAAGFWDTIAGNVQQDPDAVGFQRFARAGACPFCRMLADKGAVYRTEETARFAAHTTCHCIAKPKFRNGEFGPEADAMQYLASKKRRSPAEKARLREYLKANYGA